MSDRFRTNASPCPDPPQRHSRNIAFLHWILPVLLLIPPGCDQTATSGLVDTTAPGKDYNVVIILVDTLRPDHLGGYGYEKATSPHLDALAAESVVFEQARSASTFTGEAVAALFTGYPPAVGRDGLGWSARPTPMESNLPKRFEAAGYRTGIFSTSFVMRFRGFYDSFQEAELFPDEENTSQLDDRLTDEALDFATRHQNEKTFQYLHYYAPHAPYNPPGAYLESFSLNRDVLLPGDDVQPAALVARGMTEEDPRLAELRKHYDAEIAFVDQSIGRFLAGLKALGLEEKTIVILVSDHGEEFLEHGFADHAWNLYDETLRVPLFVWAPSMFAPTRISDPVSVVDLMPTLLRCVQIPHDPFSGPIAGQYLFEPAGSRWVYSPRIRPIYASLFPETRAQLHAVLFNGHKYIAGPRWLTPDECRQFWFLQGTLAGIARREAFLPLDPWAPPEHEALFNLATDPGENHNILEDHPDLRAMGRQLLEDYRNAGAPYRHNGQEYIPEDPFDAVFVERQLRELREGVQKSDGEDDEGDSRLTPEMLESLETMGYL